ncbi:hypothetical protein BJ912DRAFT_966103 [Pholiota molesta]|nr:hypothetical protein BJ912DRAFT_966103 [Pholiota molesta]
MDGLPTLDESVSIQEKLRIIDESIAEQQKAIDELLKPLLALKFERNTIIPISRLPPELLCRIFSLAQVPHPTATEPNLLEWINLTYVCRHWRNVAISMPSLWVIPPIGNRKWVREMLRRSKGSSLVIRSDTEKTPTRSGIVLALRQIHRIKELSLRNFYSDAWDSIREMLTKSAPQLERFCLEGVDTVWVEIDQELQVAQHLVIWDDILRETESLRQLELDYCQLNWDSPFHFFRSLTHLKLKDLPLGFLPSGKQLMNALKSMPDLEDLVLWNSLPSPIDQQSSWGSEYTHLALRSLSINSKHVAYLEAFFHYVTFPPTAIVKIVCSDNHTYRRIHTQAGAINQDTYYSGFIIALARSYSAITLDTTFHSLKQHRDSDDEHECHLLFFVDAFNMNEIVKTTAIAHLDLSLSCGSPDVVRRVITDIFDSSIPLHNISCIYLHDDISGLDSETIANTFGLKLPLLHSVVVSGNGARPFLNIMHLGIDGEAIRSGETPIQELYFPGVSSVGLHDITFRDTLEGTATTHTLFDLVPIELLQDFLIQRCELGTPIETLVLWDSSYYSIYDEDIKLLEEIVVNVERQIELKDEEYLLDWTSRSPSDEGDEGELEEEAEEA